MTLPIDCSGKVALITGATGNLGGAMAKALAQAGADIAIHYFSNAEAANKLSDEITLIGRRSCLVSGAVNDQAAIAAMKNDIEAQLGPVAILVINAVSQIHPWRSVFEETAERFQDQFETCSLQALLMTQAFVPAMCERGWGRVIGISTECIMQLYPTQSAYAGAKRGADGVLRVLASEIGKQEVTVNQVAPGWINSEGTDEHAQGYIEKNSKMGRRATDADVANCVAFLASDLARSITGQWISVSCGSVMPRV